MKTNQIIRKQLSLEPGYLETLIDLSNPWCILAKKIDWKRLEDKFSHLYSTTGRPAKTLRLMSSLLIIKQIENISDEQLVKAWKQNPYYQYFSGMEYFSWELPCDPTSLVYFRKRIGESGAEEIFKESVVLNGKDALEDEIIADTTVQEKNITYPTDSKLHLKIIRDCNIIAKMEGIKLRQTYSRVVQKLKRASRFGKGKKQALTKRKAQKQIKTLAGRLLREIKLKLINKEKYELRLSLFQQILEQNANSKNKIYSIHEPNVQCIAKGKAHKFYEFGNKVAFAVTKTTNVIVAVKSFTKNIYDGDTIPELLNVFKNIMHKLPKAMYFDRGGRGIKQYESTKIIIPENGAKNQSKYQKQKMKTAFRRRAAIEPIIGHLKKDYGLDRNYLKGNKGDAFNAIMAAAAFNIRRVMNSFYYFLTSIIRYFTQNYRIVKPI